MSQPLESISVSQAKPPFYVGVDLGGTNIKIGIVDDDGRSVAFESIPTEAEKGPEEGARRMGQGVLHLLKSTGLKPAAVGRVGLGSPGTMDIPAGMLLQPHNLPGWFNFPIRDRVSHHCGLPVTFSNDANAAAYGEFWVGCGREYHSMVLLTLGTGVGGGIIIGDLLVAGENSHGAELGHTIIDYSEDARRCPCGQLGHLEAYASATAVIARASEALQAGRKSSVTGRMEQGEELTPLLLAEEAEKGDAFALEIILETGKYLGIGMVTFGHTIDPSGIVLGGAMTFGGHDNALGRKFLARIKQEVQERAFPVVAKKMKIDFATLGGDAGYIGAAGAARLEKCRMTRVE
ncbi:MAG: ROK family protein [Pirellulales bacterium]